MCQRQPWRERVVLVRQQRSTSSPPQRSAISNGCVVSAAVRCTNKEQLLHCTALQYKYS